MGNAVKRARSRLDIRIARWEKVKKKSGHKKPGSLKAHPN